ncbi:CoF synthetase [Streptomyces luteoverticillatus]|uniref:CoF synthetase n=1 Tax=Streptomyces luteoverticillatus TaxID=66425 RepID=A0A3S9PDA6_STRLT|nr:CoF synthetase [Streptomyces luteoverticillatus]AZQ70427.1 CoF synthetase [Streptomyces luteoverticillatus]
MPYATLTAPRALTPAREAELAALAARHAQRFPWYRDLLVDRGALGSGDLSDLPVIGTDLLGAHYYTADHPHLPDASAYHTSGTSGGQRKRILYSPADDDAYVAQRRELFAEFTATVPRGAVAVADLGTGHAAASARRVFLELGFEAHDIDFTRPVDEHVAKLNAWRPEVFFTMPMILDRLLQARPALDIRPRKIMVVGDVAPPAWRAHVAERFGLRPEDVLDVFGSIEIGAIAHSCARTGLYHFHDHILPEVLPPDELGRPTGYDRVPSRQEGSGALLLTSFTRGYFPAVRYATGDAITGLRRIRHDGREVFAFERIDGRLSGDLKHGERISNHDLAQIMAEVFPGRPFEAADDDGLVIRVVADAIGDQQIAAVRAAVGRQAPDVAQMIASGLVGPVRVTAVPPDGLRSGHAKRRLDLKEG